MEIYRACLLDNRDFKVMELLPGGKLKFNEDPAERTDPLVALNAMAEVVEMLGIAYKEKMPLTAISHRITWYFPTRDDLNCLISAPGNTLLRI